MKKNINEEIKRTKEIMGLLTEQAQPCLTPPCQQKDFHIFVTCSNGLVVAPFDQTTVSGGQWAYDPNTWAQHALTFHQTKGSPQIGEVVSFTSTSDLTSAHQDATGNCLMYEGISSCSVPVTPPTTMSSNWSPAIQCTTQFGGMDAGNPVLVDTCPDCSDCVNPNIQCSSSQVDEYDCVNGVCVVASPGQGQFNSGPTSQDNENDCLASCGPQGPIDCMTGAPDWTPQQWGQGYANFVSDCDQKEQDALNGMPSGCNWICNRVQALTASLANATPGTVPHDKRGCKLDYVQAAANNVPCTSSNSGPCTTGSVACGVDTSWVQARLNHHNNHGCFGNPANWSLSNPQPASFCGKKHHFCVSPGPTTPNKQLRCDWLSGSYTPPPGCPTVPAAPTNCSC